jgi:membrane protease subunit HflC
MISKPKIVLGVVLLVLALFVIASAAYDVRETEQVIITEFGKPVGEPIT